MDKADYRVNNTLSYFKKTLNYNSTTRTIHWSWLSWECECRSNLGHFSHSLEIWSKSERFLTSKQNRQKGLPWVRLNNTYIEVIDGIASKANSCD